MKKTLALVILAILSLGLLTACGGGGGPTKEITINMGEGGEYKFSQNKLDLANGETVKVTLVNKDSTQPHSFILKDFGVKSSQVQPGKSETVTFKANKAGNFTFECDVPGHKDGGMTGTVIVK